MNDITVIIPCYNEGINLHKLIDKINPIIKLNQNIFFIIVNNGSTDNTSEILRNIFINKDKIKIINIKENKGYGHGIMHGVKKVSTEFIAWTHADLQTDIGDIVKGYKKILLLKDNKKKIIKGKRRKNTFLNDFFTRSMSIFASKYLNLRLDDINGQPKIFNRSIISEMKNPPTDFCLDLYLLYVGLKNGYEIHEFNVFFKKRYKGNSKGGGTIIGKIKLSFKTIKYIIKLK